jgi:hypothetical protein
MSTIGDIRKKCGFVLNTMIFVPCSTDFVAEVDSKLRVLAKAMCADNGVESPASEAARNIPDTNTLGEETQKLFDEFCQWFDEHDPMKM